MKESCELVLDARCLGTGIGTYSLSLIAGLKTRVPEIPVRVITTSNQRSKIQPYCDQISTLDVPIYSFREQILVPRAAGAASLFHALHYNAPLLHRGPLLVTIYDLTHILDRTFRRSLKSWIYAQPMLRLVSRKADHIFTISQYSRDCISEVLGINPEKITVTLPGVGPQFCALNRDQCSERVFAAVGQKGPFLLFVGNLKVHKNVAGLLRAMAFLRQSRGLNLRLIIVGDDPKGARELRKCCAELALETAITFVPRVSESLLVDLYNSAELLILPSFEEGFGLPVLEALACGTPVACSQSASLPEAGGDLAEYFNPHEPEDIAAGIERGLTSEKRELIRQAGPVWAADFTWTRCVDSVCDVYRRYMSA